jgi:hypothetical protein
MRIALSILILAALCCTASAQNRGQGRTRGGNNGQAAAQALASSTGFAVYRIIQTRNIFDPLRQPYSANVVQAPPQPRQRYNDTPRRAADWVALCGVMLNNGKALAFFTGSREDYNTVLGVNDDIAGAKLTSVSSAGIEVDRDGRKIIVNVGQTVPFDESPPGPAPTPQMDMPTLPSYASSSAPGANSQFAQPAAAASQAPTPDPAALSDIMRRMMERRQQQLQ